MTSKIYKYKVFNLLFKKNEDFLYLIVRIKIDIFVKNNINDENQLFILKALNEFNYKI